MADNLNLSLEPHLVDALRPLLPLASPELAAELAPYLSTDSEKRPPTIPYALLLSVSKWVRTAGDDVLRRHSPPLDPHAYAMVSLLAGATSSPEKNYGTWTPPKDPAEVQAEKHAERKKITALLNALLSILGSGFAAWWGADKTGWRDEWKVLFGLFVAVAVAITEASLYLIWQSRRSIAADRKAKRRLLAAARHKKEDEPQEATEAVGDTNSVATGTDEGTEALRRRH